ncbi:MAG: efflux RND transporter permease subunit, partial [Verrucomicrobia bacterium]|nr:efflux RND transporter permease subunit [Verrucomicrobiota bacterium]
MKAFLAAFVRHTVFANIILVLIFLVGFMATRSMVREAFPQFAIDLILVNVAYPGADPEEVEEGISRKIEEALEDIEGIKQIGTESREGSALATIEVKKGYDSADVLDRVRNRINAISTFPIDAERPTIEEFILKDPVLMLALTGDMSEMRMKEWAERLKDELQQLPAISQVQIMGTRPYEIGIEIAEERLREYRLTFDDVVGAIRRNNLTLAGGTLRTADEEIRIRTLGRKYTGEALSHIAVVTRPSGEVITLGQLGTIVDGFTEDPIMSQVNGQQAVFLSIMKTSEEDALKIAKATHTFLKRKALELPDGVGVYPVYDWSVMLKARIRLLVKNGLIGLTFVFLLLWLFLDLRLSFWAGMGMPISVAGALGILWAVGGTINMISLFGLIMVLGIIVDDAIVVGESIYVHRANGLGPVDAAVEGLREVGMPVIAAVLTTIIAFLPLSFLGGIMGKFISILPVVVIACLLVSLLECLLLLPAHLGHMNDQAPKRIKGEPNRMQRFADAMHRFSSGGLERFVKGPYARFADHVIANRYLVLCISIAVLFVTAGLLHSGLIKTSFFPAFDGFIITATAEFPDGTPLDVTRRAVEHLEASAERMAARLQTQSGDPLIDYRIALIGQTIGVGGKVGSNVGSLQLVLLDAEKRGIPSKTIIVEWEKEIGSLAGVEALTFEEMEAGPPGAPIEVWLQGMSIEQVVAASEDLQAELNNFNGVYQVHSDFRKGRTEIRLKLKPEASVLGLDVSDLANQMFAGYFGAE